MDTKALKHVRSRRTTLTLEADVAEYIEHKLAANKVLKEKHLINELLRKGIKLDESRPSTRFGIRPFKTKLAAGMTVEKLEELAREI